MTGGGRFIVGLCTVCVPVSVDEAYHIPLLRPSGKVKLDISKVEFFFEAAVSFFCGALSSFVRVRLARDLFGPVPSCYYGAPFALWFLVFTWAPGAPVAASRLLSSPVHELRNKERWHRLLTAAVPLLLYGCVGFTPVGRCMRA